MKMKTKTKKKKNFQKFQKLMPKNPSKSYQLVKKIP
jgi:hypothetical protein